MAIDLHVHSTFSDGTNTPQELVSLANKIGLSAMALTDHDTCEGVPFARDAAKGTPLKVIPGIELSTEYHHTEVHIVGLNIDPDNRELLEATREFRHKREHRNELMIELLRQQGFSITMEELIADNPDAVITRANIARFLVDHGEIGSVNHAFERYLEDDCSCYVPREKITPARACTLIQQAGGIPILAHPVLYHMKKAQLEQLIQELIPYGLKGMEVYYSTYDRGQTKDMKSLADEYGLVATGGSDYHGDNKPYIHLGTGKNNLNIPDSILSKLGI